MTRRLSQTTKDRRAFNRTVARLQAKGSERAHEIAEFIVKTIAEDPDAPYDPHNVDGEHLKFSYYVRPGDDGKAGWVISSTLRYWVFVEFGTAEHGDAQPHVRPAIDLAREHFR